MGSPYMQRGHKGCFMIIRIRSEENKCIISSRVPNMELRGEDPLLDTGTNKLSVWGYISEPSEPHFCLSLICKYETVQCDQEREGIWNVQEKGTLRAES